MSKLDASWDDIRGLFLASRFKRALCALPGLMTPAALTDHLPIEVILLSVSFVFLYGIGGLMNAYVDRDYPLKKRHILVASVIYFGIAMAPWVINVNLFVLSAIAFGFVLGVVYNRFSRRIFLLDNFLLAIIHYALPVTVSGLLVGLDHGVILKLSSNVGLAMFLFLNTRNFKGWQQDKERGYATVATLFKMQTAKRITVVTTVLGLIVFFGNYLLLPLNEVFLVGFVGFCLLFVLALNNVYKNKFRIALSFLRLNSMAMYLVVLLSTPCGFVPLALVCGYVMLYAFNDFVLKNYG
jgi:4-hydroxybenzoate polyprenyltransferase